MAEKHQNQPHAGEEVEVEVTDRGLFDFAKKKQKEEGKCQEEAMAAEFEKVKMEEEHEAEGKKHGLLAKLHRSDSSSSSSSDEEEEGEGENKEKKKKKKKGLKEKIKEKISGEGKEGEEKTGVETEEVVAVEVATPSDGDGTVHIEKVEEKIEVVEAPEEKKGFLDKIKEKLPGQHGKPSEDAPKCAPAAGQGTGEDQEKKGFLGKIMEKIPGYHKSDGGEHGGAAAPPAQ